MQNRPSAKFVLLRVPAPEYGRLSHRTFSDRHANSIGLASRKTPESPVPLFHAVHYCSRSAVNAKEMASLKRSVRIGRVSLKQRRFMEYIRYFSFVSVPKGNGESHLIGYDPPFLLVIQCLWGWGCFPIIRTPCLPCPGAGRSPPGYRRPDFPAVRRSNGTAPLAVRPIPAGPWQCCAPVHSGLPSNAHRPIR